MSGHGEHESIVDPRHLFLTPADVIRIRVAGFGGLRLGEQIAPCAIRRLTDDAVNGIEDGCSKSGVNSVEPG
jgi:hypothetical protein